MNIPLSTNFIYNSIWINKLEKLLDERIAALQKIAKRRDTIGTEITKMYVILGIHKQANDYDISVDIPEYSKEDAERLLIGYNKVLEDIDAADDKIRRSMYDIRSKIRDIKYSNSEVI